MAKKRLRKGEGRVQIIACRDRANELAEAGYGPVRIFEILTKEKRISMSYSGFYEAYRYGEIRKQRRRSGSSGESKQVAAVSEPPESKISGKKQPFAAFREQLAKAQAQASKPSSRKRDGEYSEEELFGK